MHSFSTKELQLILKDSCSFKGNTAVMLSGFCPVMEATSQHLSWIRPGLEKAAYYINNTQAGGIICDEVAHALFTGSNDNILFIITPKPLLAFAKILRHFEEEKNQPLIHPTAIIHPDCKMGSGVRVGAYSIIDDCTIGDNTVVDNNVRIFKKVSIGSNCHIREFCSIGGAGFGITQDEDGNNIHVPHAGRAVIGNNVLIFPFSNIDVGMLGDTIIEDHVAIDHYCHIGHNSFTGRNTIITAGTVLAGGAKVSDNCFIGLNTLVKEKAKIGSFATTGMGTVVTGNIPDHETWVGNPATELKSFMRQRAYIKNNSR